MRVRELQYDSVADAARALERLRAVTGDPYRRNTAIGPRHLNVLTFTGDSPAGAEIANNLDGFLEAFESQRLLAHHPTRAVASADTQIHSPDGDGIKSRKQAGGDRCVSDTRIGHAGAEPHALRRLSHQSQERIWVFP